mgnify:CR=1 FL=1|jgi:hypothetical protein
MLAAVGVIVYSIGNMIYVFYRYTNFKPTTVFRAIPNYFKTLSNSQKMDQLDNETFYRSYGFTILHDKSLKML